jgi:hypothetical protein
MARPYNCIPWSADEDAAVRRLVDAGAYKALIGRSIPGRSVTAVESRLMALALTPKRLTAEQRRQLNLANIEKQRTPPEKLAEIRQLAASRMPASAIAVEVGTTKNAIVSICRNNGIPLLGRRGDRRPKAKPAKPAKPAGPASPNRNRTGWTLAKHNTKLERVTGPEKTAIPAGTPRKSFEDIEFNECRYPCCEPELILTDTPIFCGARAILGKSWCEVHAAIVYDRRPRRQVFVPIPRR